MAPALGRVRRRCLLGLLVFGLTARVADLPSAAVAVPTARSAGDLLVVGAGVLGRRVGLLWKAAQPQARIVAATLSTASHEELQNLGFEPVTVADLEASSPRPTFSHVLFAAPPYGSKNQPSDYAEAVAGALAFWDKQGSFVFTSSASVYAEDSGGLVDESSALASSESATRLLKSEQLTLKAGGTVLRLAGLYDTRRGPHSYWLQTGLVKGTPEGLINLVHYDDAASAVVAALQHRGSKAGEVFVVADGRPVSRREICEAAVSSQSFKGLKMPAFEAAAASAPPQGGIGAGKVLNARRAQQVLGWMPRYASFGQYMSTV